MLDYLKFFGVKLKKLSVKKLKRLDILGQFGNYEMES